jgi:hypothetical protein
MPTLLGEPNYNLLVYVTPPTPKGRCPQPGCQGGCNHADPRITDERVVFSTWCTADAVEQLDSKYPGAKALIAQLRALILLRQNESAPEDMTHWQCPNCGAANQGKICTACGKLRRAAPV